VEPENLTNSSNNEVKKVDSTKQSKIMTTNKGTDQQSSLANMDKRKKGILKSIRLHLALLKMDVEIKKSLRVDKTDVKRCCLIMDDLMNIEMVKEDIFKAPEIVETIKKCRKFKSSEKVCLKAAECYSKFQKMFQISSNETFLNVYEKERTQYMTHNEIRLDKERVLANRILLDDYFKKSSNKTIINNKNITSPFKTKSKTETKIDSPNVKREPTLKDTEQVLEPANDKPMEKVQEQSTKAITDSSLITD
jgi:hypothetical protein